MEGSSGATGTATVDPPGRINHGFTSTGETLSTTEFRYFGDRPARWTTAPDPWAHGLFRWSWADWHLPITAVDTTARTLTLANEPPYGLAAARPYYAYNLLEEITQAGEFYVDRTTGILYLFPPGPLAGAEVLVSMLETPVVRLSDASWIVLRDLVVEAGRANLVEIDGGGDVIVEGCELRNGGIDALDAWNGERVTVRRCRIHGLGDGGILVSGGDRRALAPAGHLVENCDIHDVGRFCWMYTPAVRVEGAGSTVRKNHLHDLPHSAILWGGNEHLLELNEIDHVCNWASDAGAIYAGRDWGARGNVIRHNLVRHMSTFVEGWGVHGIYLDDCLSGVTVEGNIVYDVSGLGLLLGGGRDNTIRHNVLAKCGTGLSADSRGPDNINDTPGDSWNLLEKLLDVGYRDEPWASRYPACAAIPATFAEISASGTGWMYPEGVVLRGNLGWQNSQFAREEAGTFAWFADYADNVEDADPRFVDEAAGNLALQPDSPAYAIPGFAAIPYADIGIAP
jgi:parallel beta-helix repeat protein